MCGGGGGGSMRDWREDYFGPRIVSLYFVCGTVLFFSQDHVYKNKTENLLYKH